METRITELEIKISYAEDLVDELNRLVFRQQQQIDFLARELNTLRQQLPASAPTQTNSLLDELPPHY
ncbi:MAG: SlyX family protein [Rhodocyclaceae bacterium]|nr:SlyX family protein [Rhodocyclaceae bacterium]